MSGQDAFARTLGAMYDALLDDARWPAASALIDEACGISGNDLFVAEGPKDDVRGLFVGIFRRGQRREDLEREYLANYFAIDESVPRFQQLPDGGLVHQRDLYTAEELKSSPAYNEALPRGDCQDGLRVRLHGPDSSRIAWNLGDPVDSVGWAASRIAMVTELARHVRQFVGIRQALVRAGARTRDRDRPARQFAGRRRSSGPARADPGGQRPRPRHPPERRRVVGPGRNAARSRAPPTRLVWSGWWAVPCRRPTRPPVSGSILLRRSSLLPPFVVHVKPVAVPQPDYGARHVAALMLIAEPGRRHRISPEVVATTLELTPGETQVAVWLAEGKSVRDMAEATGRTEGAIYRHLKHIYQKQSISRQADLVRLVLTLAE